MIRGHRAGLFYGQSGEITCAEHAPYHGTDTWRWGKFRRITEALEAAFVAAGMKPTCESCGRTRHAAETMAA